LANAYQCEHHVQTAGGMAIADITDDVIRAIRASGIKDGLAYVYSPQTTCSVRVNEVETGLFDDFAVLLMRLVPALSYCEEDDLDDRTDSVWSKGLDRRDNHAHCLSMLLGATGESIPVQDGKLCLGRWQRILFLELDRAGDRSWLVQVIGV
jgi:secondary thiamine-phosphate synthase enzyme